MPRALHPQHCHCWSCSDDPALRARQKRPAEPSLRAARIDALTLTTLAILAVAVSITPLFAKALP